MADIRASNSTSTSYSKERQSCGKEKITPSKASQDKHFKETITVARA